MTDKELLELAAKAAGIDGRYLENQVCGVSETIRTGLYNNIRWWNPLTDDGDALRLAVNLGLLDDIGCSLYFADGDDNSVVFQGFSGKVHITEVVESDYYAATRRAIVRAAAEIGKEKS